MNLVPHLTSGIAAVAVVAAAILVELDDSGGGSGTSPPLRTLASAQRLVEHTGPARAAAGIDGTSRDAADARPGTAHASDSRRAPMQ